MLSFVRCLFVELIRLFGFHYLVYECHGTLLLTTGYSNIGRFNSTFSLSRSYVYNSIKLLFIGVLLLMISCMKSFFFLFESPYRFMFLFITRLFIYFI